MTLSVAVMAHPKRSEMVADLVATLGPVPVVWDELNDRHDTGVRAVEAYDPAATHHLVIQDDAVPSVDLLAGIERALTHVPDGRPASFYLGRVRPFAGAVNRAVESAPPDLSWLVMDGVYWGPAIVYPTECIPDLSRWYRGAAARKVPNYDRRVSRWFEQQHRECWYSWPSLVDHRGDSSLVGGHRAVRRCHRFCEGSALDVDWSGSVVRVANGRRLDRTRQQLAKGAR